MILEAIVVSITEQEMEIVHSPREPGRDESVLDREGDACSVERRIIVDWVLEIARRSARFEAAVMVSSESNVGRDDRSG